jgi:hypothetical protein
MLDHDTPARGRWAPPGPEHVAVQAAYADPRVTRWLTYGTDVNFSFREIS